MPNAKRYVRTSQRQRRDILTQLIADMGASAFSQFMVDTLSEVGGSLLVTDLPALADIWYAKQRAQAAAEDAGWVERFWPAS